MAKQYFKNGVNYDWAIARIKHWLYAAELDEKRGLKAAANGSRLRASEMMYELYKIHGFNIQQIMNDVKPQRF